MTPNSKDTVPADHATLPDLPWDDRRQALWRKRLALEAKRDEAHRKNRRAGTGLLNQLSAYRLAGWALKLAGLYDRGLRNARHPVLEELTFEFDSLPDAFDGFNLLQLSDMHFSQDDPEFVQILWDCVEGVETDLCVFTGDYRFGHAGPIDYVIDPMVGMVSRIRSHHGFLAIFGNHDHTSFAGPLRDHGVTVLINQHVEMSRDNDSIWVAGVDDPFHFRCDDLPLAMEGIPDDAFTILLAHSPQLAEKAPDHGVDLYLCGHTHWGQVAFPYIGGVYFNVPSRRRYSSGRWHAGATQGYTSPGLGVTDLPVRFNCPPTATRLHLRKRPR
jgi:predicted MPP superfamily phosphohydrolase